GVRCEHDAFLSRSHPYGTLPGLRYTPSGTALARRALANQPAGNAAAAHARDTERRNPNLRSFMSTVDLPAPGAPLTLLSDDEEASRDAVREFARNEVAPLAPRMDEAQQTDSGLSRQLFEMGLMGVDVPESLGGAETSFFIAVLVVEELSRVDPSVGVLVDVQNTLVNNAFLRWGSEALRERYLPRLCSE